MAPEVLYDNQAIGGGHSYEVDCWSIGVILYTMLCGRPPFESSDVKQTYQKIKYGTFNFPENVEVHPCARSFIRSCLITDPTKRMTLQEMLRHDFIVGAGLPKQLPVSTLVCAPQESFTCQYNLDVNKAMFSPAPKSASKRFPNQSDFKSQKSLKESA